jgi:hypothetical protein
MVGPIAASSGRSKGSGVQPPTSQLQELLRRLGEAAHGSVRDSAEVRACLAHLRQRGFDATLLLEVSLSGPADDGSISDETTVHLRLRPAGDQPVYRIDLDDARFLTEVGISPSRHRSPVAGPSASRDDQPSGQDS